MFNNKKIKELETRVEQLESRSQIYPKDGTVHIARAVDLLLGYLGLEITRTVHGCPPEWKLKKRKK